LREKLVATSSLLEQFLEKVRQSQVLIEPPIRPVATEAPSDVVQLARALEQGRLHIVSALGLGQELVSLASRAQRSRSQQLAVRGGFERIVTRACYRQAKLEGDRISSSFECSSSNYVLAVTDPLGYLSVAAGILAPIYATKPRIYSIGAEDALEHSAADQSFGDVAPAVFVGARVLLDEPSMMSLGGELGFGVGNKIGQLYSLGAFFGVSGLSVGIGAYLDTKGDVRAVPEAVGTLDQRTTRVPLLNPYIRLGISADLWEIGSRSTAGGGPQNAPDSEDGATSPDGAASPGSTPSPSPPASPPGSADSAPAPEATPPSRPDSDGKFQVIPQLQENPG
jgi:hypothetical protein